MTNPPSKDQSGIVPAQTPSPKPVDNASETSETPEVGYSAGSFTNCKVCVCHNPVMSGFGCKHCVSVIQIVTRTLRQEAGRFPEALSNGSGPGVSEDSMPSPDKEENPR